MKKIITIKKSTLGTSIVVRSPISRKWLFNVTLAPIQPLEINTNVPNVLGKLGFASALVLFTVIFLGACTTSPETETKSNVETKYVADSLETFKSCWYPWSTNDQRDSLIIDGKRYTVSERSRYRLVNEPANFGDVEAEGAVTLVDYGFYMDTKDSLVIVLNKCEVAK